MSKVCIDKFVLATDTEDKNVVDCKQFFAMFNFEMTTEEDEDGNTHYYLDEDDHEWLMGFTGNVCDGYGKWTGNEESIESWVRNNADYIHSFWHEYAEGNCMTPWEVLERAGVHEYASWVIESLLQDGVSKEYGLSRGLGRWVGQELVNLYQYFMEEDV